MWVAVQCKYVSNIKNSSWDIQRGSGHSATSLVVGLLQLPEAISTVEMLGQVTLLSPSVLTLQLDHCYKGKKKKPNWFHNDPTLL